MADLTSWTDAERGRIQRALLYSPAPFTYVPIGFDVYKDEDLVGLANRLPSLDESTKGAALALADKIVAYESEIQTRALKAPDVSKVGDITRSVEQAISTIEKVLVRMRGQLADLVSWHVNPNPSTPARTAAGGINATVS